LPGMHEAFNDDGKVTAKKAYWSAADVKQL
jgi:hypothetical protein